MPYMAKRHERCCLLERTSKSYRSSEHCCCCSTTAIFIARTLQHACPAALWICLTSPRPSSFAFPLRPPVRPTLSGRSAVTLPAMGLSSFCSKLFAACCGGKLPASAPSSRHIANHVIQDAPRIASMIQCWQTASVKPSPICWASWKTYVLSPLAPRHLLTRCSEPKLTSSRESPSTH